MPFWDLCSEYILSCWLLDFPNDIAQKYHKKIMKEIKNFNWTGFCRIPEVNAPKWPKDLQKLFKRHVSAESDPWLNWIAIRMSGTTPSGRAS